MDRPRLAGDRQRRCGRAVTRRVWLVAAGVLYAVGWAAGLIWIIATGTDMNWWIWATMIAPVGIGALLFIPWAE